MNALDRLRRKKPNARRVSICMDPALAGEVERVKDQINGLRNPRGARIGDDPPAEIAALEDDLETAEMMARAESEWFVVQAMAPDEFDELADLHKPTVEQAKAERKKNGPRATLAWNPSTYPVALIAVSVSLVTATDTNPETGDPVEELTPLTEDFVREMRKSGQWSPAEIVYLFNEALTINSTVPQVNAAGNG